MSDLLQPGMFVVATTDHVAEPAPFLLGEEGPGAIQVRSSFVRRTRADISISKVIKVNVTVEVLEQVTDEVVNAFGRLLPQLSRSAQPLDETGLQRLVSCEVNTVLIARTPDLIVGTLTLVMFPIPTGLRARIEDVVVDESARGQGVGAILTEEALRLARQAGARTVDLTSRPDRGPANRLYQRLGFQLRESQVYRFTPE